MVVLPKAPYPLIGSCDIPKDADFDTEFNGIIY